MLSVLFSFWCFFIQFAYCVCNDTAYHFQKNPFVPCSCEGIQFSEFLQLTIILFTSPSCFIIFDDFSCCEPCISAQYYCICIFLVFRYHQILLLPDLPGKMAQDPLPAVSSVFFFLGLDGCPSHFLL